MTFDEVDEIICSYGFYCDCTDALAHPSKYYKYPNIDRLVIWAENECVHNENSLDKKRFSDRERNRVDLVSFNSIVLFDSGRIGINYSGEQLRLYRKNVHTDEFKLTKKRLHIEVSKLKNWLESLLKAQKEFRMNNKLKKMETDFND